MRPAASSSTPWTRIGYPWGLLVVLLIAPLARAPAQSLIPNQLQSTARANRLARFLNGRRVQGTQPPAQALLQARQQQLALLALPRTSTLSAPWTSVGPNQVASNLYGDVTGRVTSIAIDPADATGNTVYLGTTGGGVWKSTNAAGPVSLVNFVPLTDTLPIFNANAGTSAIASLSIGAVGIGNGILLAGTGDPNDASDSYYGEGILRSADGGSTWTLSQGSLDGVAGNHSFTGLSVAGFAFSTVNPSLMVAALSEAAEGVLVNAPDATNSVKGLYVSSDAGLTWQMAVILDGSQTVQTPQPTGGNAGGNAATAVVWNPVRQRFYAAVRYHGYYESADGATWTRLAHQPGAGLTTTACPTDPGSIGNVHCPIYRGALAVQPVTGDLFALTVDASNLDQGLYQDLCASNGNACASNTVSFATALPSAPLEVGNGSSTILQADYNLTLAASPLGADTVVYAGTIDLYRCTLAGRCTLRNTTNAQNGCLNPAGVGAAQHAVSTLAGAGAPLVYLGNDSGLWRSVDGIAETGTACSMADAAHFQNLNQGLGSLAEIVSFAQDPTSTSTLLAGLGALGTAGTGSSASAWPQLATGEGGTVAIDPATPSNWYLSTGAGVSIGRCGSGANCAAADFTPNDIGEAQVANDLAAIHAPWLLDPAFSANLLVGTCRVWRGPASNGALWSSSNSLSRPFGTPAATACASTAPVVRSLATGGAVSNSTNAQSAGSEVLYAGLAGTLDGGQGFGGHLFATFAADLATSQTVWSDLAASPVTNDVADSGVFNPGGFDVSSIAADPHDATGRTVYATVMGFAGNRVNAPHLYRSIDGGAHWTNISSNLPNAPANSVIVDPNDANTLYVGLDTGLYVTTGVANCTTANCWSVFGSGLPNAPVVELEAAPSMPTGDGRTGMLRAATYGRGIWQTPLLTAVASAVPVMAINPAALSFQSQQIGTQSAAIPVTVTNVGNAPLTVSSVATTGDFTETDSCVGPTIAQGASCTVSVIFVPTATGARTGLLTVYGNVVGGQATASLTGTGTPASTVVLTPTTLNFVPTSLGATSLPGFITLSNLGTRTVALAVPVTSGDFKITANTCGSSLAPGTGCTIGVAFAPTASGTRTGTLTAVDDVGTQVASLIGTGTAPATDTLSPLALSFAGQVLNTTSPLQAITLTNSGDVPLTLIAAQITSGDFTVVNGCGNSLTGHASCTLSVAYVPKAVGLEAGVLTISDQYRAQAVQLAGFGLAPAGVSLSPLGGLSFGAVGLGIPAAPQTLLLTNNGGTTLAIDAISVTGDFFLVAATNTCGVSLAPSAVCTVQIGFTPTLPGVRTGLVSFLDSALNSPQTSSLTGTGVDFTLLPDGPTSMSITSGQSATYGLLLSSASGLPGTAQFTCAGAPAHTLCTVNPGSAALGATTLVTVTVATGQATARLEPPPGSATRNLEWAALLLPLGALAWRRRRSLAVLAAVLLVLGSGCSAGREIPGDGTTPTSTPTPTPSGSYTLVVAGASAGLVRQVSLSLTVK